MGGLVIGLTLTLAGVDGPRTQSVRQFARNLLPLGDLPIVFWDERLSTAAVTREMIAHDPEAPGPNRRPRRRRLHPAGISRFSQPDRS